ncbi:MAG: outer membrane protein assembly factor BamB family protein, partial [Verrucomicrobiales bacterium]
MEARSGKMNENKQLKKAYGTPLVTQLGGKDQLLSNAADWLYAYDPATGKELWKMAYGRLGFSNVARPVIGHGMIYLPTGFSKSQMFGIKADGKGKAEIAWEYKRNVPTTPSPILVGEALYFVSDQGGLVTCLDAKSGELIWKERAGGNAHWASPLYGDGKLYFHSEEGLTMVLKPGQAFEKLAENQLDGLIMGSAA